MNKNKGREREKRNEKNEGDSGVAGRSNYSCWG
jgi:hypothetical protein